MLILGISAFYHDSAAALLKDGEIVAAAQEERFTRIKHDARFPINAIKYCLEAANVALPQVDHIVFYEKPFVKFERLLETYLAFAPRGFLSFVKAMPVWIKEKLFQRDIIKKRLQALVPEKINFDGKLLFSEHHLSHAASAYYPSPFDEAIVLTMDGVGEWATTSVAIGKGNQLTVKKEIHFPHSLGLLYSAFTYYTGFKVNSGEYKVMGLAPYGTPTYKDVILKHLVDLKPDGTFFLDMSYFNYCTGTTMTNEKFHKLFGGPPRDPQTDDLAQRHMDLAASIQAVTEEIVLRLARALRMEYGIKNLCLAGGVALNCVANGKIVSEKVFDKVWIQPAAGDAGGALGAAQIAHHIYLNQPKKNLADAMQGAFLGPSFLQGEVEQRLTAIGAELEVLEAHSMIDATVDALMSGKAVGWFQGRMEFGPRSLGARSILADPRNSEMQKVLNLKVKFRESFRPFAPSVRREDLNEWFDLDEDSPYMLVVANIAESKRRGMTQEEQSLFGIDKLNICRSSIPAVTHVDYSARVQSVSQDTNPLFHALLTAFKERTGCAVLVNTSFNVRGEPIVHTPEDAFRCFMGTDLDLLVIGNAVLRKDQQDMRLKMNYSSSFAPD